MQRTAASKYFSRIVRAMIFLAVRSNCTTYNYFSYYVEILPRVAFFTTMKKKSLFILVERTSSWKKKLKICTKQIDFYSCMTRSLVDFDFSGESLIYNLSYGTYHRSQSELLIVLSRFYWRNVLWKVLTKKNVHLKIKLLICFVNKI